jgi:hypothetical protein
MNEAERLEFDRHSQDLSDLQDEALPILKEISVHTRRARKAMGGRTLNDDNEIIDLDVDTLTLSNEQVELAILLQRLGDRLSEMGYIARAAKEFYERVREGHKVRLTQVGEAREVEETNKEGGEITTKTKYFTVAAGVADSMKIELAHEAFGIHNECEKTMDQLAYARKSTDKTIDTIRSKLSYEKANDKNA